MGSKIEREAGDESGSESELLPLQPFPLVHWVAYVTVEGHVCTAIGRRWAPGDCGVNGEYGRCTRCPDGCAAHDGGCVLNVGTYIPDDSAPTFSPRDIGAREQIPPVRSRPAGGGSGRLRGR